MLGRIPFLNKKLLRLLAGFSMLLLLGCPSSDLAPIGQGRGKILRIDTVHTMITLDHDRVPAMMQSLVMSYPVESRGLFNGLRVGDSVAFTLHSAGSAKFTITSLEKIPTKP